KPHFETLEGERSDNLKKKESLCQKIEAIEATPNDEMNWKELGATIQALEEEWKQVGPVPKEASDTIWKRFRGVCRRLYNRRKAHFNERNEARVEHGKQLELLCERAEAVAATPDATINWKSAADQLKAFQAEWKAVGPALKEQSE